MDTAIRRTAVPYDLKQPSGTIIDILNYYATICATEFCGKCMPCRYGTKQWTFTLKKIQEGQGKLEDLNVLRTINSSMKTTSFCRLGLISPYIIDSILKYYQKEIEDYIVHKTPLSTQLTHLPQFIIQKKLCDGCPEEDKAPCQNICPVRAIEGEKGSLHIINQAKCFRCDDCTPVCPKKAIAFVNPS